jgi:aminoglycoside phosphotransferase (APT) family kinase protein
MEFVAGEIVRTDGALLELGGEGREAGHSLIDGLAALHAVDPAAVGLADFGRPHGFMTRQVRRWTAQLQASRSRDLPGIEKLSETLAGAVPQHADATLIHGDYRLDNCILRRGQVAAVLDWEMSTLGDPLADLALFAVYTGGFSDFPGHVIHSPAGVGCFPSTGELLDRYVSATGRDLDQFGWYVGFAWFKLAVILEGIHYRYTLGQTVGAGFDRIGELVPVFVENGLTTLQEG